MPPIALYTKGGRSTLTQCTPNEAHPMKGTEAAPKTLGMLGGQRSVSTGNEGIVWLQASCTLALEQTQSQSACY